MIKKLDHVAIAVKSITQTLSFYQEVLGLSPTHIADVPNQGSRVAFLPIGDTEIELVEPLDPQGTLAQSINKRGEGLHHICLEVENIDAVLEDLRARGVDLIDQEARPGALGRVAFVHPRSTNGVLLELSQRV